MKNMYNTYDFREYIDNQNKLFIKLYNNFY